MGSGVRRGFAAAGTVLLASAANVTTGLLTQHWTIAWWVATGVLVVVGAGSQWWLTVTDGSVGSTGQQIEHTTVSGSLRQEMRQPGTQSVIRSEIVGDLTQTQGGDGDCGS